MAREHLHARLDGRWPLVALLARLGVRYKGPIKVYAVGEYADGSYMLKMSYGVGAAKTSSSLAEALKPRCSDSKSIEAFEACLLKGLPNGAPNPNIHKENPTGVQIEFVSNSKQQ